jgi:hypothetical protein
MNFFVFDPVLSKWWVIQTLEAQTEVQHILVY